MQDTLIVGCSFVVAINYNPLKIDRYGSCAASNTSIAARVLYQLSQKSYKKVIVLWSGINRLSLPIDIDLHNLYQEQHNPYIFYDNQGSTVWYHSGGILGTAWHKNVPTFIKNYFSNQYKTASSQYLTDQTLTNIIAVQSVLENKQINYSMSFIYDVHNDYSNERFGYSLGQLDISSPLYNLVNWSKINQHISPYEWAKQNNHLEEDQFHVTSLGLQHWFNNYLNIHLLS